MGRKGKTSSHGFTWKIMFVTSGIVVAVTVLQVFYIYPRFRSFLTDESSRESLENANFIVHEMDELMSPGTPLEDADVVEELKEHLEDSVSMQENLKIEKMKVYSSTGSIIYSPDSSEIGTIHPYSLYWEKVTSGEVFSKFVQHDTPTLEGETVLLDVIETYVPIMEGDRFLGAVELYQDISLRMSRNNALTRWASALTLGLTGTILLAMALLSWRDEKTEIRRRQLEEQLIRSDRLAAIGTLVGGISHEFNNINLSVMGFSQVALDKKDLAPDTRKCLVRIHQASKRAHSVTTNLLDFSRGRKRLPSMGNLSTVVLDALSLVRTYFEKDGIVIKVSQEEVPDTPMESDQITQVILNLMTNARHAMLDCPDKVMTVATARTGDRVHASVSDTGCGIAKDQLEHVFDPFFSTKGEHAVDSPQSRVKGTGLGLSICHTIVMNHGGEIAVDSKPGVGTTITISLPADSKRATEVPAGAGGDVSTS